MITLNTMSSEMKRKRSSASLRPPGGRRAQASQAWGVVLAASRLLSCRRCELHRRSRAIVLATLLPLLLIHRGPHDVEQPLYLFLVARRCHRRGLVLSPLAWRRESWPLLARTFHTVSGAIAKALILGL